ncbi:pilus assembly protein TadG-related protein [Streptomyces niveiscabiei]|uniref:pilus assembly protein TadG-related protein n=1 Tax=Streptomyces niveiscabiei TaxID=164115 RepID=UPI003EBEB024
MTPARRRGDTGQAFPIYIMVVAGLLFLAFAYLAVGQAGANRGDAQAAADAAALAAAQETRDELAGEWVKNVLDPTKWDDIFDGVGSGNTCWRAYQLAEANDAEAFCDPGIMRYSVEARTNKSVGDSVVPGTEEYHSTARATAVIDLVCSFDALPSPTPTPTPSPTPTGDEGGETPGGGGTPPIQLPVLHCDGGDWTLDPQNLRLPEPQDLFDVHLVE